MNERRPLPINKRFSGTVTTPSPKPSPAPQRTPQHTPQPPRPAKKEDPPIAHWFNGLWLVTLWVLFVIIIALGFGWNPISHKDVVIDASVFSTQVAQVATAKALAVEPSVAAKPFAVAEETPEGVDATRMPVDAPKNAVLVYDNLPWYILREDVPDASFTAFNGSLFILKVAPFQDTGVRDGVDQKLCWIVTIHDSQLVKVVVPCWRIGK